VFGIVVDMEPEVEIAMRPIEAGKREAAEQEQRPESERAVAIANGEKKRSQLRMGAIVTALFVCSSLSFVLASISPTPIQCSLY
jgi:hypothetical protein